MNTDGKRIMILGAGIYQLAGIRAAVDLGLHTITVDYLPDNIGHRISHQFVDASTTDPELVLARAREVGIDGIVTFASDVAIATVAFVAEQLGLPGCGVGVAAAMCNKARFRELQRERGLPAPGFASGRTPDELEPGVARLRPPLVVKPVDTSGSRGIARVDATERAAWEPAFARALSFSRSGEVCVEELIEGADVTGEGLMRDGEIAFVAFTLKHRREFVVLGHELPGPLPESAQRLARDAISATCRELGYRDGPFDCDLIVAPDRAVVIEIGPRTGGNGIPPLLAHAAGVDLHAAAVLAAVGAAPRVTASGPMRAAGSMVIGAPHAGVLTAIATAEELRARAPEVVEYVTAYRPGDRVSALEHGGASLGYCVFTRPDREPWAAAAYRLAQAIGVEVRAADPT
jgi:biotin carboxylase